MTAWSSSALLSICLMAVAGPDGHASGTRLFSFQGDDVYESSALVDRGRLVYTINDSGDDARVYGVDSRTGRTITTTSYAGSVTDVESLAPGADGTLWVGDTGDNRENRDDIAVYRVHPLDGDHPGTKYALRYPGGPRDAETLLVQPRTQRVFVVSKSFFGGTVYAAPRTLRTGGVNRLHRFARVSGLVTDGTFFPDGRRVLLRTYTSASVYTFPAFRLVGTVALPDQPQGEGISVSRTGRVLLSSEGVHSNVLQITLPSRLTKPDARSTKVTPSPRPRAPLPPERTTGDRVGIGLVAATIAAVVALVVRAAPRRGRRTR